MEKRAEREGGWRKSEWLPSLRADEKSSRGEEKDLRGGGGAVDRGGVERREEESEFLDCILSSPASAGVRLPPATLRPASEWPSSLRDGPCWLLVPTGEGSSRSGRM